MADDDIVEFKVNKNPDVRAGHFADSNKFTVAGLDGEFDDLFDAISAADKNGLLKSGAQIRITEAE